MNDLSGKCVNVVLAIEMGRGMGFLEQPVKIIANFNGRPLESDLADAGECPLFNTVLAWEIEKKELRKLRSARTPLRVDVQVSDNNQRKEFVGFVLLSPRCASVVPHDSKLEIPFKWHKLLGVAAEYKCLHPELYLSLTIRDANSMRSSDAPVLTDLTIEEEAEASTEKLVDNESSGKAIPIQYLEDGFIQVGTDNCKEKYLLSILIQVAYNLDLLLPEVLVFNQNRGKYFISFRMFGISIKSKPFSRDLHASIPMNEKIVVRIVSNYATLQMYLTQYCQIVISFYCGHDKLGMTNLQINPLLEDICEENFIKMDSASSYEKRCFFKFPSPHGIIPTGNDERQPYIEVLTYLKRTELTSRRSLPEYVAQITSGDEPSPEVAPQPAPALAPAQESSSEEMIAETLKMPEEEPHENPVKETETEIEKHEDPIEDEEQEGAVEDLVNAKQQLSSRSEGKGDAVCLKKKETDEGTKTPVTASGDQNGSLTLELKDLAPTKMEKKIQSAVVLTARSEAVSESCRSVDSVLKNVPPLSSIACLKKTEDLNKSITLYQQYCLDVVVETVTLKKQIKATKLCIKFVHPKASTVITETAEIDNHVGEDIILESARCKVFFISTTDHIRKMVYAWPPKLILTNEKDVNLTEELDIYTAMFLAKNRIECSYVTECKALRTYEPLAKVSIIMYLQEYGLSAIPTHTSFDLLPPILDENIAIKELQELQEWKETEKMRFSIDLKILQKQRMTAMKREWFQKKSKLEEKLNKSVQRCESLSQELQTAIDTVRINNTFEQKESDATTLTKSTFDDTLEKNTIKYSNSKKSELINVISKTDCENENLKSIVNDQKTEIEQIKKTALTKEQTTNLLQQLRGLEEKFEDAQKAKTYFKEQWKRAVKEIHDLRSEDQKQIQEKIQNQKIELSQLSLEEFLGGNADLPKFDYEHDAFGMHRTFGTFKWDPGTPSKTSSMSFGCTKDN